MQTKREDYLFLSSMLRAREVKMLSRDKAERMLDAPSYGECAKLLTDCGYEDLSQCSAAEIDRDILYSILDKDSKRAQAYWFVSVQVLNEPDTMYYDVETYGTDFIYRIRLSLGFKCSPLVNVYLRQIVQDLQADGTLPRQEKKYSIYGPSSVGTFKFCMIHKTVPAKTELSSLDEFILHSKYFIRRLAGSKMRWYGLDTSSMIVERVPLITGVQNARRIQRNIKS